MRITTKSSLTSLVRAITIVTLLTSGAVIAGGWKSHHSKDIVDTAIGAKNFSTLLTAVKKAGLVDALKGKGPYTLFAPTDEAFAKIPADQLQALLKDKKALTSVLTYHVVPANVSSKDVMKLKSAKTLQGQSVTISTSNGVRINGANVIKTDIVASNGVIHVIDQVILPK